MNEPLVVTLLLDEQSQLRFESERLRYFPAGRTQVGAHVTLFHALPASLRDDIEKALADVQEAMPVSVDDVHSLGRGVAYGLSCQPLEAAHRGWQDRWREHLTSQDAQPLRLHVTVQNRVPADVARSTLTELRGRFEPWTSTGRALELWRYDGGPWTHLSSFPLRSSR